VKKTKCSNTQTAERLSEGILLYDNKGLHSAAQTKETLYQHKSEALDYPPYSPDLAPSDHLCELLKEDLTGYQFAHNDKVTEILHDWLHTQPKAFYNGVTRVVDHWTKYTENQEHYEEK
jgi:transposase